MLLFSVLADSVFARVSNMKIQGEKKTQHFNALYLDRCLLSITARTVEMFSSCFVLLF